MGRTGLVLLALLAACGRPEPRVAISATGPIRAACMAADRTAASPELCGCVQAVADARLTGGEQRRAAEFFSEPHLSQELRQSDRARDETFWQRWKAYGAEAERVCRGVAAV